MGDGHSPGQLAALGEATVGVEDTVGAVRLLPGGDAEAMQLGLTESRTLEPLVRGRVGDERLDKDRGALVERALGRTVGLPLDAPVPGIRRRSVDARHLEGEAVDPRAVPVAVLEDHRAVAHDAIEERPRRCAAREGGQAPAAADDDRPVGVARDVVGDETEVGLGGRAAREVALQSMEAGRDRMDVGVLEARQQGPATEVDPTRVRTGQRPDVVVAPDRHDPPTGHGHRFCRRTSVVDRADTAAQEDDVRVARGGHGARVY